MKHLIDSYGRVLTAIFVLAVGFWALLLIVLPQGTILERALTLPKRQLDSSVAATLRGDAVTCLSVLGTYLDSDTTTAASERGAVTGYPGFGFRGAEVRPGARLRPGRCPATSPIRPWPRAGRRKRHRDRPPRRTG